MPRLIFPFDWLDPHVAYFGFVAEYDGENDAVPTLATVIPTVQLLLFLAGLRFWRRQDKNDISTKSRMRSGGLRCNKFTTELKDNENLESTGSYFG